MLLVLVAAMNVSAQSFKMTTDTICLDSTKYRYITMMTDYHDNYVCVVTPVAKEEEKDAIIMVDKNTKKVTRLSLPQQWMDDEDADVESMYVRNDSLIIKPYETYERYMFRYGLLVNDKWFNRAAASDLEELERMERLQDYCLNPVTMKWEPAIRACDEILSNRKYVVTYKNLGEWGGYTIFTERENGRHHCYGGVTRRLLEKGGKYYWLGVQTIRRIDNPKKDVVFTGTDYHMLDHNKQYTIVPKLFEVENDTTLFEQMGWEPVTYTQQMRKLYRHEAEIRDGFFIKNQLYLLIHSNAGLALALYQDGTIIKVLDIFKGYMHPLYLVASCGIREKCLENDKARMEFYDVTRKKSLLLNIDRYDIRLTYFMIS